MNRNNVYPAERAGGLDNWLRRLVHNPRRLLGPYLKPGMKVLDIGCGPGVFTLEAARLVGQDGRVTAIDIQEEMLKLVRKKISGTGLERNIDTRRCEPDSLGVDEKYDFIVAFYVIHEVPDRKNLFVEISRALKKGGKVFVVEPTFRVSKEGFSDYRRELSDMGFSVTDTTKILLSRSLLATLN